MIMLTNLQLIRGRDYSVKQHSQKLSQGKDTTSQVWAPLSSRSEE